MVKVKGAVPFTGVITDASDLRPEYGGKDYQLEVVIDADRSKAYIVDDEDYEKMGFPRNFSPYGTSEEEPMINRKVKGEYWVYKGKKIIVSLKYMGE